MLKTDVASVVGLLPVMAACHMLITYLLYCMFLLANKVMMMMTGSHRKTFGHVLGR